MKKSVVTIALLLSLIFCCVDAISIEDAHRRNDPSLLAQFKHKKVILGLLT